MKYPKGRSIGFSLLFFIGCASPPQPSLPTTKPFYVIQKDLKVKADAHRRATIAMVDSSGQLCYRGALPWGGGVRGTSNYLWSHDIADMPAWHGVLMQAIALEGAVTGNNLSGLIDHLVNGMLAHFEVTGVEGLLCRSAIPDYVGPRLSWMATEAQRPTKYWTQNARGQWYRNGLAKNHWNQVVNGCALILYFHRQNKLILAPGTVNKTKRLLLGLVRHLKGGGWRIRDVDGTFTEFGDLRPSVALGPEWPVLGVANGFNQVLVLNALKAASYLDATFANDYEAAKVWIPEIRTTLTVVGRGVRLYGHERFDKPSFSDMHALGTAATTLLLQETEDQVVRTGIKDALKGLWVFMGYENNPTFSLAMEVAGLDGNAGNVLRLLRHFPGRDGKKGFQFTFRDSSHYQPIENRTPSTMYWKSSPFRLALSVGPKVNTNPETGDEQIYAGADYLSAYWMGRYLGVLPPR